MNTWRKSISLAKKWITSLQKLIVTQQIHSINDNKIYYTLPLLDYMFRLLRVIIRPSNELIQNYLIPSALWDLVALTIVGAIVLWVHTGCPRRKGPNFGRVFLRSNYTDITQNTYIQSLMVTETLNIEK